MDYVCPFSAKLANAINTVLVPLFAKGGKYDGKVKVIFRNQVQPWHASSTWVHEAGLAVGVEAPISQMYTHSFLGRPSFPREFLAILSCRESIRISPV